MSTQPKPRDITDVLQSAIESAAFSTGCVVNRWAASQGAPVQDLLKKVSESRRSISSAKLYRALNEAASVPFGISSFRYHLAEDCACQNN